MKPSRIPIALEGIPYIVFAFFTTLILALLGLKIPTLISLLISFLIMNFFRDPHRVIPYDSNLLVSPADGVVVDISETDKTPLQDGESIRISIFMNIFNVHVNRTPCDGEVLSIKYYPGRFLPADKKEAIIENERCAILMKNNNYKVTVVQVAGLIARRIVCWAEVGDIFKKGEKFGLIQFGSRVDVYLPKNVEILVKKREKVKAGETPIASIIASEVNK